tara:strand:+ start:293 stop:481 length:189 start_codon:yes stop_codon:yes gene_type:complete
MKASDDSIKSELHTLNREIGSTLKSIRRQKQLSQNKLSEILGVTFNQIQKYENGKNSGQPPF